MLAVLIGWSMFIQGCQIFPDKASVATAVEAAEQAAAAEQTAVEERVAAPEPAGTSEEEVESLAGSRFDVPFEGADVICSMDKITGCDERTTAFVLQEDGRLANRDTAVTDYINAHLGR